MEIYKNYYFDTKHQRISSAAYLRELLYSMFTMLQQTKVPYIPRSTQTLLKSNATQKDIIGSQIFLTWQEFHKKLLQSLDRENISTWTREELMIWWAMVKYLHLSLLEFASKNGWAPRFIKYSENFENLIKHYKICENTFKSDSYYANSIHLNHNELFGSCSPCNLESINKGIIPVIEGKVLLNSQHDFNYLFGIEDTFLNSKGTEISLDDENVMKLKKYLQIVQEHLRPLEQLLLQK